jgi:hypothetical protein
MEIRVEQNTQKTKTVVQTKILSYLQIYAALIGIEEWTIVAGFKKLGVDELGQCEAEVEYKRAVITFDSVRLAEHSDIKLRKTVIHELLHCLVWRLAEVAQHLAPEEHKEFIQKFEEEVVTNLERMPIWDLAPTKTGSENG